jgi:hypothetical protein
MEEQSYNEIVDSRELLGMVLVKELRNPGSQCLSRRDTMMAFNTIFRLI